MYRDLFTYTDLCLYLYNARVRGETIHLEW
jgi:hypothetical protein